MAHSIIEQKRKETCLLSKVLLQIFLGCQEQKISMNKEVQLVTYIRYLAIFYVLELV